MNRPSTTSKAPYLVSCLLLLSSCAFKVVVSSEKTTVEQQMIGEYAAIEDDVVLYSVVRGEKGESKLSQVELARLNQRFNLDEIDELKDKQVIGETYDGLLALVPEDKGGLSNASKLELRLSRLLIDEENRDRSVIFMDIISRSADLKEGDLAKVRNSYAATIREKAKPGHFIQMEPGVWTTKQGLDASLP